MTMLGRDRQVTGSLGQTGILLSHAVSAGAYTRSTSPDLDGPTHERKSQNYTLNVLPK